MVEANAEVATMGGKSMPSQEVDRNQAFMLDCQFRISIYSLSYNLVTIIETGEKS